MNNTLANYHPKASTCDEVTWKQIAPAVRSAVELMDPSEGDATQKWANITTTYFAWCVAHGHDLTVTEPKIASHCAQLATSAKTVHRNVAGLRSIGQRQGTLPVATQVVLPSRKSGSRPIYTASELTHWWQVASQQPSALRRRELSTLIALGAGAGLMSAECAGLAAADVEPHPDHADLVLVHLPDRVVPVDSIWGPRLTDLVEQCPSEHLFRQSAKVQRDFVGAVKSRVQPPTDAPPLSMQRLRNTWLVAMMCRRLTVPELYAVSGIRSASALEELAPHVPGAFDDGRYLRIAAGLEKGL